MLKQVSTLIIILSIVTNSHLVMAKDPLLSLKNLERERADFIHFALSDHSDIAKKQQIALRKLMQLSDMERMVIRDERLVQTNDVLVQQAFSDFELTFLVHASAEQKQSPLSHWLAQVGFDSQSILNAQAGFRK